ncbi:hypothetical protein BURKHO8Y_70061 [Burkholderia sp. 8Y]|nr:hypothetical protein BURKHO8Y_70061 [Burkholderia sp. 8Y]
MPLPVAVNGLAPRKHGAPENYFLQAALQILQSDGQNNFPRGTTLRDALTGKSYMTGP